MNKFKKYIVSFTIILITIIIFINQTIAKNEIINTSILWFNLILPTIPVSYFLGNLIYSFNYLLNLPYKWIKKILPFENLTSFTIFIVSIIIGNPTSTILINNALKNNYISLNEAKRLLRFSSFISLFFILFVFEKNISMILLFSQIGASLILISFSKCKTDNKTLDILPFNLTSLIEKLPEILLQILSTMIIVSIVKLPIKVLFADSKYLFPTIISYLELTSGIITLKNLYSGILLLIFSSLILSFHGFAILLQVIIYIKKMTLSIYEYLKYRIIHAILATILSIIIYLLFNFVF